MRKPFRDALLAYSENTGVSLKSIAEGAGVSYEQLKKLKQREGAGTDADDAIRIANYLGYTLEEFVDDALVRDRAEIASLYNQLSPRERAILRAAGQVAPDTDQAAS